MMLSGSKGPVSFTLLFFGLFLAAWFFFLPPLYSQQDILEYEKSLEKIEAQINSLKAKIQKEEMKKASVLSQLAKIGFEKELIQNEISLYSLRVEAANSQLSAIRKSIPLLQEKLDEEKESIEKILLSLYKFGKFKPIEFFLQIKDVGSLISESKNLTLLAQSQDKIVSEYRETLSQIKAAEQKEELKKREITQLIDDAQNKKQQLDMQEKKNMDFIREITQNKKNYIKILEELKNRAEELQVLINKLLEKDSTLPFPLIPLENRQGELGWPIVGKIVTNFGLQRHAQFKTVTENNGIEISAKKNMSVQSIHTGVIVFNDYFQGYGNLIIIDHGLSYYSLYGHCSTILVKKGDEVKEGQPIAIVGDIDSLKGINLYFEIRHKTTPLNPLQWLKKR